MKKSDAECLSRKIQAKKICKFLASLARVGEAERLGIFGLHAVSHAPVMSFSGLREINGRNLSMTKQNLILAIYF